MSDLKKNQEEILKAYTEQTESFKRLEAKISAILQKEPKKAFDTTLKSIKSTKCALLVQIWAFIVIVISLIGFSSFMIFSKGDSPVIIPITILSISFLIIIMWLILRLNLIRESLTNKHIALSTFAEIQPILQNTEKDMSYEYRAVIKRILDSLNNLIDNTQNET